MVVVYTAVVFFLERYSMLVFYGAKRRFRTIDVQMIRKTQNRGRQPFQLAMTFQGDAKNRMCDIYLTETVPAKEIFRS